MGKVEQLMLLAHGWAHETYMKAIGKSFDIDLAKNNLRSALTAALADERQKALEDAAATCLVPFTCRHPNCVNACDEEDGGCQADLANDSWQARSTGEAQQCAAAIRQLKERT